MSMCDQYVRALHAVFLPENTAPEAHAWLCSSTCRQLPLSCASIWR
uniref:Putative gamma-type carbonic anhydrase n=1 Tax=Auxenochlorella pyrenoidosa TaxID=3078 RepID=I6W818_AUXPY|nr:putative gamma-type carbonic anhydrase [Auxenochlorella pyrenoidosa]